MSRRRQVFQLQTHTHTQSMITNSLDSRTVLNSTFQVPE